MLDARPVEGFFRTLRWRVTTVLLLILFVIQWVRIDGRPLVLLDIGARRFHFGPLTIFPDELYFLWLLIIGLAIALFFFTAIAGRLWCGWACPQTVFTDVFAAIGRRIEGWKGHVRPKHVSPWRRVLMHAVWLLLCAVFAFHLVAYFHSPYDLVSEIRAGLLPKTATGIWAFLTLVTYADFAIVRQTFCKYLCPYARFQSVMFDRDTLVIGYDTKRGEPRGKRAGGDCIDCSLCVQVCPTGIDIRDGLQLGCIACSQCVDACDGVMEKTGREPGLIAYRALSTLEEGRPPRLLRPRVVVYAMLLVLLAGTFVALLAARKPFEMQVVRGRGDVYRVAADGRAENVYKLHILNRIGEPRSFRVRLEGGPGFELVTGLNPVPVPATGDVETSVFVLAPPKARIGPGGQEVRFVLEPVDDDSVRIERKARFLARRSAG